MLALQRSAGNHAVAQLLQRVDMEAETVTSTPESRADTAQRRAVAHAAVVGEIDRAVGAVQQGHRQGLAAFAAWYGGYASAQENATTEGAAKVFGFLLKKGLDIVFPEEALFFAVLKQAAELAFDAAKDHLGAISSGNVGAYLAALQQAEEGAITELLDHRDTFVREHTDVVDEAVMEFVFAQQDGWSPGADGDLPPAALARLHRAGVGSHGAGAATLFAERWLTAHIEAVYRQNEMTMRGIGDSIDVRDLAEIAALQQLDPIGNRDRAFELERRLPVFFRSIADINHESASMLHIRLDLDQDVAESIETSRNRDGAFGDPHDLVSRGLVSEEDYGRLAKQLVAH